MAAYPTILYPIRGPEALAPGSGAASASGGAPASTAPVCLAPRAPPLVYYGAAVAPPRGPTAPGVGAVFHV